MGQEDPKRKQYFVSDQTWEGLQICVKSFVEVVRFSLDIPRVNFVVATKFNQDVLENFFGNLDKREKLKEHSPAKNLFTAIVVLFSVRHMQLRLYVAHF